MPEQGILLLHGLGGNAESLTSVAIRMKKKLPGSQVEQLEGPVDFGEPGSPSLGWFEPPGDERRSLEESNRPSLDGIDASLTYVHQSIDKCIASGLPSESIHLVGHSQGGAIAMTAGLTYPQRLGSVCTIAGYLALTREMEQSLTKKGTPFCLHHCIHDDNVTFRWANYAKTFIEKTGSDCEVCEWEYENYPHAIYGSQVNAICDYILKR